MDEADQAQVYIDATRDRAIDLSRRLIEAQRPLGMRCLNCGEALRAPGRYCDSECREDDERRQRQKK